MIELISDLPEALVGLRLSGTVTADEYREVLEPALSAAAAERGVLDVVVVLGDDLDFTAAAALEDAVTGLREIHRWGRIAVVSDHQAINTAIGAFAAIARIDARVFARADEAAAIAWVERSG